MNPETFMAFAISQTKQKALFGKTNIGLALTKNNHLVSYGTPDLPHYLPPKTSDTLYLTLELTQQKWLKDLLKKGDLKEIFIATAYPDIPQHQEFYQLLQQQPQLKIHYGLLARNAFLLNGPLFKNLWQKKPYVLAKWAMTCDGKIATQTQKSQWISNKQSRHYTHNLRGQYQAILVGIGTVLADDPLLTCRSGGPNPIRIILDRQLRLPQNSKIYKTTPQIETHLFYQNTKESQKTKATFKKQGFHLHPLQNITFKEVLKQLFQHGIKSILIEGGGTILESAFQEQVIDEVQFFVGPKIFGGEKAKTPVEGQGVTEIATAWKIEELSIQKVGGDIWGQGYLALNQTLKAYQKQFFPTAALKS